MRLEDINYQNAVGIGYYDPFGVFPAVETDIARQLPLSNLHWRHHPLKPVKSIPLLPVKLVEELPPKHTSHSDANGVSSSSSVYLRLMFVKMDSIEVYRSQMRPLIMEWLKNRVSGQRTSWAVVLVVPGGQRDKKSTLVKTSLYDKLRTDFGPGGKRLPEAGLGMENASDSDTEPPVSVVRLHEVYDSELARLEAYNEFQNQLKSLVLHTFDMRYAHSAGAIERYSQRLQESEGDQFAYVVERLRLAHIFSDMRCLTESLELYEESARDLTVLWESRRAAFAAPSVSDMEQCPLERKDQKEHQEKKEKDEKEEKDQNGQKGKKEESQDKNSTERKEVKKEPKEEPKRKDSDPKSTPFNPELFLTRLDPERLLQIQPVNAFGAKLGLFLKTAETLQMLANFAASISIAASYMSQLLQRLIGFLHDVLSAEISPKEPVQQWAYAVADFYLQLPLSTKLAELDAERGDDVSNVTGILEYSAELQLLQRTLLTDLARSAGLQCPDYFFQEISLDDDSPAPFVPSYEPLARFLADQSSYEAQFEHLTLGAIRDFAACNRIKTVDLLSIDIALTRYRHKEYQAAYDILSNSYDYFLQNGWNFMGGILLEVYLACIENLHPDNVAQILDTSLQLFSSLQADNSVSHGINNYHLLKRSDQREQLYQKICSLSESLPEPVKHPLSRLFSFQIDPYIAAVPDSEDYCIALTVTNSLGTAIALQSASVVLAGVSSDHELVFSRNDVVLANGENSISLRTHDFHQTDFQLQSVELQLTEKLVLHDAPDAPSPDDTVIVHKKSDSLQTFRMYQVPGHFRVEIVPPTRIELGTSSLECIVHTGASAVQNLSLQLATSTIGLGIFHSHEPVPVGDLAPHTAYKHTFAFKSDSKTIEPKVTCTYETDGTPHSFRLHETYDMNLAVSISVSDFFRMESLYSKFQVECSDINNPIKISGCEFTCPKEKYTVHGRGLTKELLVLPDQSAFIFYRITPRAEGFNPADSLSLTITYSSVKQECAAIAKQHFTKMLEKGSFARYLHLLLPVIKKLSFNLATYGVDGKVVPKNVPECAKELDSVVGAHVPPKDRDALRALLKEFQKHEFTKENGKEDSEDFEHQQLYIPVSVPYINMLHQVEFKLQKQPRYVVGEPINATLVIESTSKWTNEEKVLAASSPEPNSKNTFEIEVLNEDDWVLSGMRKQEFTVDKETATTELQMCLIPLNVGEVLFPRVSVRAVHDSSYTVDVVHENALETTLVVPELESITFAF